MKIYLGADHRGFTLKEKIAKWLFEKKFDFVDVGAEKLDPEDDYTKYASQVASLVATQAGDRGILLCGSGVGVEVVANKFDGVRAAIGKNKAQVVAGRTDDDLNVLVIAADYTDEKQALELVEAFLKTGYDRKARHQRRLEEIKRIEANN